MPLLRNNAFIADTWSFVADDAALESGARAVVSFDRLQKDWDVLATHDGLLGVSIPNTLRANDLLPYFSRLALIVLPFPAFTDGRSYSLARQLRLDGYRGGLRATGNILPDQLQFMLQVGVDSFDVPDRFPIEVWQKAAEAIHLTYQRGYEKQTGARDVWSQRHKAAEAWEEQPHAG